MKRFFLICLPFLISACSFRPDRSVVYGSEIPGSSLKVIYDQRVPDFMGGEEYVDVEFQDGSRHRIDNNGRYSEWLRVDVSGDARWYRLYMKNRYRLVGHTVYRDVC